MGGEALRAALGFPTTGAMRRALARGALPVPVFQMEGRRGRFALTKDVAGWIARQMAAERATMANPH